MVRLLIEDNHSITRSCKEPWQEVDRLMTSLYFQIITKSNISNQPQKPLFNSTLNSKSACFTFTNASNWLRSWKNHSWLQISLLSNTINPCNCNTIPTPGRKNTHLFSKSGLHALWLVIVPTLCTALRISNLRSPNSSNCNLQNTWLPCREIA